LLLAPFFEVPPDFSRYFLPSFAILSIMRAYHVPHSDLLCYWQKYSGLRSRSCEESANAGPCNKPWSCHNASARS
jgi:hypothetical protein